MLSSDTAARPQSSREVADLLQPFCDASGPKELIRAAMQSTVEDEHSALQHSLLVARTVELPPRPRWPWWIAAALIPFAFAAGIFITLATDNGTLVIESVEPSVNVKVVQGDRVVDQLEITQLQPSTLSLRSGRYVVELTGVDSDRMEIKNNQVVLSRGDKQVVTITRKEAMASTPSTSQAASPSASQLTDGLKQTLAALAVPAKTFEDKSLAEWTGILTRERSEESIAQAMRAVHFLVDAPDEKLAAARQFLQASRTMRRESLFPTGTILSALESYFPKLYSTSPESGLQLIADELENGTPQSKTVCIYLLNHFLSHPEKAKGTFLFDEMNQVEESRNLLHRLDRLVAVSLDEIVIRVLANELGYNNPREMSYKLRFAINKSLERDLKQDAHMMAWAKDKLNQYSKNLTNSSFVFDAFTAAASFRLLEATDLDLSPLLFGLLQSTNEMSLSELDSIVAKLCQREPMNCVRACENFLAPGRERGRLLLTDSRGQRVLDNLAKNHPQPLVAITKILNDFGPNSLFSNSNQSTIQQLLVRVVLELDMDNDREVDSKLAYAACAFAHFEIPSEYSEKVMAIFFQRLRTHDLKNSTIGKTLQSVATFDSYDSWYKSSFRYNSQKREQIWNPKQLRSFVDGCCIRNPSAALEALVKEVSLEVVGDNQAQPSWLETYLRNFQGPLRLLTTKAKGTDETDRAEPTKVLLEYLQSETAKAQITKISMAIDALLERMLKKPIPEEGSVFADDLTFVFIDRLAIAKFLNQDLKNSEALSRAIRSLAKVESRWTITVIEEAIAELVGDQEYPIQRLCTLAQSPTSIEFQASNFVRRIYDAEPRKFQLYFLSRFENVETLEDASKLFDNWYDISRSNRTWDTIFQKLLDAPVSGEATIKAIQRLIEIVIRDSDELNVKYRVDALKSLQKPK